jgi:hypothetical protein
MRSFLLAAADSTATDTATGAATTIMDTVTEVLGNVVPMAVVVLLAFMALPLAASLVLKGGAGSVKGGGGGRSYDPGPATWSYGGARGLTRDEYDFAKYGHDEDGWGDFMRSKGARF